MKTFYITIWFLILHVGGAALMITQFSLEAFIVMFPTWMITSIGVTAGYHRLLTHKGFKAPKWLERLLLLAGMSSTEGDAGTWTAVHRPHHENSDKEGDPHSPNYGVSDFWRGLWWAQLEWIRTWWANLDVDAQWEEHLRPYERNDWFLIWTRKLYLLFVIFFVAVGPFLLGWRGGYLSGSMQLGVSYIAYVGFGRTLMALHFTGFVNSLSHLFGTRAHDTDDDSRNNWLVAILAWGEGWHNNHHAFQNSARHGFTPGTWYDPTWAFLRLLAAAGFIWDVIDVESDGNGGYKYVKRFPKKNS